MSGASAPAVLVVPRDAEHGRWLCDQLSAAGFAGACARDAGEALRRAPERLSLCLSHARHADALLPALRRQRPQCPVLVLDDDENVERAVAAMRQGAADYFAARRPERLLDKVRQHCLPPGPERQVISAAPQSARLLELAQRVAGTEVSVMIIGESGTGKEVIARYIHGASRRAAGPFVAINCAAIPENMLEAILFGHVKGAFTGAHQHQPGKFELADGGTLLLDEVTEMPLSLQAKLLRVLQEREVERLGARAPLPVDVRVLATTNVDIRAAVAEGRFREDLYYRLSVFPLQLTPLRERPADIAALAQHFILRHGGGAATLSEQALAALAAYRWPGNVRELENTVQRALVLCDGAVIRPEHLLLADAAVGSAATTGIADGTGAARQIATGAVTDASIAGAPVPRALSARFRGAETEVILEALAANGGQRRRTARALGISERTLRYRLARLRDQGVEV